MRLCHYSLSLTVSQAPCFLTHLFMLVTKNQEAVGLIGHFRSNLGQFRRQTYANLQATSRRRWKKVGCLYCLFFRFLINNCLQTLVSGVARSWRIKTCFSQVFLVFSALLFFRVIRILEYKSHIIEISSKGERRN